MTTIGFIGGTGPEGKGLAYRFAHAGHEIVIGSRRPERAQEAAQEVAAKVTGANVAGTENADAAARAELIVLTVPFSAQADTIPALQDAIAGKIVVSTGVPMAFEGGKASLLSVAEGSAAEQVQALLPDARVVGAFHNLSAKKLSDGGELAEQDVLVCGDDADAKRDVMALAEQIAGVRAVDAGALAGSRYVEAITVLLVAINRRYKALAGVRIVGV